MVSAEDLIEFNRDIRPILSEYCFTCHGPDRNQRQADLRLDVDPATDPMGVASRLLHPGDAASSELLRRMRSGDVDEHMPPPSFGKQPSPAQIELVERWINSGAAYQGHWAYEPLRRPSLPSVPLKARVQTEVDRFIVARLTAAGLEQQAPADRVTLIRRLSMDLTGLPPTPDEVAEFVADTHPDAVDQVIDRLLASPHFGERMAMYWLDLVRFADTIGYHSDNPRAIAPYRDYVIRSFNENKPFDKFTIEQLAGDLLPDSTLTQRVASGYNRLLQTTEEGGAQAKEYTAKYDSDRVRNFAAVWLGSTMNCCECHDHKYDPFTQRDFYSLAAFFADIVETPVGRREPGMLVPTAEQQEQLTAAEAAVVSADQELQAAAEKLLADSANLTQRVPSFVAIPFGPEAPLHRAAAASGAELQPQEDGGLLATREVPDRDTYTLDFRLGAGTWSAVRLDVQPDDSLPKRGPGRDGNFVLTTIRLRDAAGKDLPFARAAASFAQDQFPVENALNDDPNQGWAVWPRVGEEHSAVFQLKTPLVLAEPATVTLELRCQHSAPKHVIGRFRLSATANDRPLDYWLPGPLLNIAEGLGTASAEDRQRLLSWIIQRSALLDEPRQQLAAAKGHRDAVLGQIPRSLVTERMAPRGVRVLPRGNWMDDSGPVMEPAVPAVLGALKPTDQRPTRLELARWVTDTENPLPARVFVNRLWKLYFGVGLSKTLEDYGSQGEWPTHPELLEYLAADFRDSSWNIKQLIRQLVRSATYQQSSTLTPAARQIDPLNRLFSAQHRPRYDAELIRDQALAIAGLLSLEIGGSSTKPYQPAGYWDYLNFPTRSWQADTDQRQYRRGLYTHWQRSFLHPSLMTFDAPSREECTAERPRSNTPQQALVLLNDPTYVEAARVFAERTLAAVPATQGDVARLEWAYRRAVARPPRDDERQLLLGLLERSRAEFRDAPKRVQAVLQVGIAPVNSQLDPVETAAWTNVTRVILNLHELMTRL